MSLSGTQEGGLLPFINAATCGEINTPASTQVPATGGQAEGTAPALGEGRGLSEFGRITTPDPLWDNTQRVLLAWRPCEVTRRGVVTTCANLTAEERTRLADNTRTMAVRAADAVQDNAPATDAIDMFDPAVQTWGIVAAPPSGFTYTDPVALLARPEPSAALPTMVDAALASSWSSSAARAPSTRSTTARCATSPDCKARWCWSRRCRPLARSMAGASSAPN